jgi:hypothetical protein
VVIDFQKYINLFDIIILKNAEKRDEAKLSFSSQLLELRCKILCNVDYKNFYDIYEILFSTITDIVVA